MLLAVDLGLRTGFALYGRDGRLVSYRSQNLGSKARLKRAAGSLLADHRDAERVVLEGGGDIADLWLRAAERAGRDAIRIDAHVWRKKLLLPREQRHGTDDQRGDLKHDTTSRQVHQQTTTEISNQGAQVKHRD